MTKRPSKRQRVKAVKQWASTPARNPDYRGATPNDVGRALLRKPHPAVKTRV